MENKSFFSASVTSRCELTSNEFTFYAHSQHTDSTNGSVLKMDLDGIDMVTSPWKIHLSQ